MKFLKVMLVITMLLANYSATAHAFARSHDCAEHMAEHTADKSHASGSHMKDCCKDMAAKMKECNCGACGSCVATAAILLAGFGMTPPAPADIISADPAGFVPRLGLFSDLRPPDLLA